MMILRKWAVGKENEPYVLQHLLYGTPEPRRRRLLNATSVWEREKQCPAWRAFSNKQQRLLLWVRAAGWSLSCCGISAAIHHWGRAEKGVLCPWYWGGWLINPWSQTQCAGFRGCLFTSTACAAHRNPKGPHSPFLAEQGWWSSSHLTPGWWGASPAIPGGCGNTAESLGYLSHNRASGKSRGA